MGNTMKLIFIILLSGSFLVGANEFVLESGKNQTQIIELYTSEGCSSCPPADRWISQLKHSKDLWSAFIPMAFHVDYWDYIGWKDKLALANNSHRQQIHRIFNNIPTVYTPGILKAGKEWRNWRFIQSNNVTIPPINVGKLTAKLFDNQLTANFSPTNPLEKYKLNIALMGMNIKNSIKAGENHGKLLKHDFVILKHQSYLSSTPEWDLTLDSNFLKHTYTDLAFVAWIEAEKNPSPIQAVGKFL
jgi:hypothetical protein